MTLRVANWSEHFENNRTRELKVMTWVPVPTKQDGDGYTQVMDHPQGAAHFGAWIAMLQVAAKCDERGTLTRDGRNGVRVPHDAASLSRLTRIPARILSDAINRLLEIGWLEDDADDVAASALESTCPQDSAITPQEGATIPQDAAPSRARAVGQDRTEQERTGQGACAPRSSPLRPVEYPLPDALNVPAFRAAWSDWFDYRRERNLGAWKPRTIEAKLAELEPLGPAVATEAIRRSIANGWQGIFPDRRGSADGPARYRGSGKAPSHAVSSATKAALAKLSGKETAA